MKKIILFVGQDSGSGNALFLVIKKLSKDKNFDIKIFASKQSKSLFEEQHIPYTDLDHKDLYEEVDCKPELIVTGASMRNCIEKEALLYARNNNIKTITILDFWSNYWERFSATAEKNITLLPDYIFVMDSIAKNQMIDEGFPANRIIITGNPYFDTFGICEQREDDVNTHSILYVSQPIYQDGYYKTDCSIFEDFLTVFSELNKEANIIIRPHPKDEPGAYAKFSDERITIDSEKDIKDLIRGCNIIIGKNSTVLFEAVFSGKWVISYQPVPEKPDRLVTNELKLSYLVRSKPELGKILREILSRKVKIKKIRLFEYYNDGKCTERVIKYIKKILG